MVHKIYHGGHADAGFFIHAVNTYYGGVSVSGEIARLKSKDISACSDVEIDSEELLPLFLPVLDEWRLKKADNGIVHVLRNKHLVRLVNEGRCRIFFDFSNEAGTEALLELLSNILRDAGVERLNSAWLICQNRMLAGSQDQVIQSIPFDFFLLAGLSAAIASKPVGGDSLLINSIRTSTKSFNITCLNATPRMHRVHTLLEIMNLNLHVSASTPKRHDYAFPYLSMPLFNDSKGGGLSADEIERYLSSINKAHLVPTLHLLSKMLPLKADDFSEKGNQLVTKINLNHYLESLISVITETGVNAGIKRITEKTIKPLAFGHPFVIVGHIGSVEMVRELGFSAMDDFIDHSYDTMIDPSERLQAAVLAAGDFIERVKAGRVDCEVLSNQALSNIEWAANGFLPFYWHTYVDPILDLLKP